MKNNFKLRAKEMGYSNLNYPYAEKGPKLMRPILNIVSYGILCLLASALLKIWQFNMDVPNDLSKIKELVERRITLGHVIGAEGWNGKFDMLKRMVFEAIGAGNGLEYRDVALWGATHNVINILMFIFSLLFFAFVILGIMYINNVKKRAKEYERNIILNDIQAALLYMKIQSALKIKKRLKEAKNSTFHKSSKGSDTQEPTADNLAKVDELRLMKKMDVRINTRQKLASNKINTIYSIFMKLPHDETTTQNLLKRIEHLNDTVTRIARGKVTIGGYQIAEDRHLIIMQGETPDLDDPYDYELKLSAIKKSDVVTEYYESAFPISLLVNKEAEIIEKKELAQEWAMRNGAMLDRYLITAKMKVTRLDTIVSSSGATFIYDLALDSNLSGGFNKFDEAIDKAFKLRGSSVSITNGHLEIILPIPTEYKIPINVPTMFNEIFGITKPE